MGNKTLIFAVGSIFSTATMVVTNAVAVTTTTATNTATNIAASAPTAMPAIELYGRLDVSARSSRRQNATTLDLTNNSSRLGVRGEKMLDERASVVYQLEYGVDIFDDNSARPFFTQRDMYAGLKGTWGSLMLGKLSTPLKSAKHQVDLFNDRAGELKSLITNSSNRNSSTLMYRSPAAPHHFTVTTAYITPKNHRATSAYSVALTYNHKRYFAVAFDQHVESPGVKVLRLVHQYPVGRMQFGAFYEYQWGAEAGMADGHAGLVSAKYTADKLIFKAQAGLSGIHQRLDTGNDEKGKTCSLGIDYRATDKATVYSYYAAERSNSNRLDNTYVGIGIRYDF